MYRQKDFFGLTCKVFGVDGQQSGSEKGISRWWILAMYVDSRGWFVS